jgi:hypothetical protein
LGWISNVGALPNGQSEISAEHHGLTKDGMRYFGLLPLRSAYSAMRTR